MAEKVTGGQAALVGAVLFGAVLVSYDSLKEQPTKTEAEVKSDGTALEYNVFASKQDGGATLYFVPLKDGGVARLSTSPCARRPTGVKASTCLKLLSDGGTQEQGDENTMQPGQWVGSGCVRTACVVLAGEEPETK